MESQRNGPKIKKINGTVLDEAESLRPDPGENGEAVIFEGSIGEPVAGKSNIYKYTASADRHDDIKIIVGELLQFISAEELHRSFWNRANQTHALELQTEVRKWQKENIWLKPLPRNSWSTGLNDYYLFKV